MGNLAEEQQNEQVEATIVEGTLKNQPDFRTRITDIINKSVQILMNPNTIWRQLKAESNTIKEIYLGHLIYLAAIPAICGFIGMTIIGVSMPFAGTIKAGFFAGLIYHIGFYINSLISIFIGALIIEFLAPMFDGKTDRTSAFKLLAYSMTAVYLAGVFSLIPLLGILGAILSLYSMYLYYEGIPLMTGVPATGKRIGFFFTSIIGMIVASLVIWAFIGMITPNPINSATTPMDIDFSSMDMGA